MTYITYTVGTELKSTIEETGKTKIWTVAKVDGDVMTLTSQSWYGSEDQAWNGGGTYYTETRKLKMRKDYTSEEVVG